MHLDSGGKQRPSSSRMSTGSIDPSQPTDQITLAPGASSTSPTVLTPAQGGSGCTPPAASARRGAHRQHHDQIRDITIVYNFVEYYSDRAVFDESTVRL